MKFHVEGFDELADISAQSAAIDAAMTPIRAQQAMIASPFAATVRPNLDGLLPRIDLTDIFQTHDLIWSIIPPHFAWLEQVNRQLTAPIFPTISIPRFELPASVFDIFRFAEFEALERKPLLPPNWPDDIHEHLPTLLDMVNIEGIPVAWVPGQTVLEKLLAASSATERTELLISHRDEVVDACLDWVDQLEDDVLAQQLPIAKKVLAACKDGHWEVAAISAVAVVHSVVEALQWVSDRQRAPKQHQLTMGVQLSSLLEQATRASLVLFYDDWHPKSGKSRPAHLTRHVVSHRLAEDQVSARNCIVAVMLMSSLLVTVKQLRLGPSEVAA